MSPTSRRTTMTVEDLLAAKVAWNPRAIDDHDLAALRRSLDEFGCVEPVVFNERTGHIVGGHQRVDAAASLDWEELPVEIIDVDEAKEVALNVALNRISGRWEWGALSSVLDDLDESALALTGFSEREFEILREDGDLLRYEDERRERAGEAEGSGGDGGASAEDKRKASETLASRFLVPPFSVLDARAGYWQERKKAWGALGVRGEFGRKEKLTFKADLLVKAWDGPATSTFDPVLCEIAYRWYSPPGGSVLDPFAGGLVRGFVASALGREYVGVDLREEQVRANEDQLRSVGASGSGPEPEWIVGDSRTDLPGGPFDLLFSCPPYHDLERYSEEPEDLSAMGWDDFLLAYRKIIQEGVRRLADDRFAFWVVSEIRDRKGACRGLVPETIRAFADAGATLYNEAVLILAPNSLPLRAARSFVASRKLGRNHQNVLVFVKGDGAKATEAIGSVGEFDLPEPDTEEDDR